MKRLFILGSVLVAACSIAPSAYADEASTDPVGSGTYTASAEEVPAGSLSILNPILSKIPLLKGPDRRHVCVISDDLDKSWCFYVAIP